MLSLAVANSKISIFPLAVATFQSRIHHNISCVQRSPLAELQSQVTARQTLLHRLKIGKMSALKWKTWRFKHKYISRCRTRWDICVWGREHLSPPLVTSWSAEYLFQYCKYLHPLFRTQRLSFKTSLSRQQTSPLQGTSNDIKKIW